MKIFCPFPGLALVAALVTAGCSSTGYKKAESSSTSIQKAAQGIDKTSAQIDTVLGSLTDLLINSAPDLKPQFKKFQSDLRDLESLADDLNVKTDAMSKAGAAYFETWDADLATIQNEEIRARSAERRRAVEARFDRLRSNYELTRTAFVPFFSDLRDIHTALAADLTPGGLNSIKSVASKANQDAGPLREDLNRLAVDFKEMGIALSSRTPAP